jgi:hypothetical protein
MNIILVAAATTLSLSVGFANADDERSPLRPTPRAPGATLDLVALASDPLAQAPLEKAPPTVPQVKGARQAQAVDSPLLSPLRSVVALV